MRCVGVYYIHGQRNGRGGIGEDIMAKQKTFNVTFWNAKGESLGTVEGVKATTSNSAAAAALQIYTPFYFVSFTSEAA